MRLSQLVAILDAVEKRVYRRDSKGRFAGGGGGGGRKGGKSKGKSPKGGGGGTASLDERRALVDMKRDRDNAFLDGRHGDAKALERKVKAKEKQLFSEPDNPAADKAYRAYFRAANHYGSDSVQAARARNKWHALENTSPRERARAERNLKAAQKHRSRMYTFEGKVSNAKIKWQDTATRYGHNDPRTKKQLNRVMDMEDKLNAMYEQADRYYD